MREKDPRLFMALKREKKLDSYAQRICQEASEMVTGLLKNSPKDKNGQAPPADQHRAEEIVRAHFLEFPTPLKDQTPEPPDDLPTPTSPEPITASNPVASRKGAGRSSRPATTSPPSNSRSG
jgi:hypothetical protein